MEQAEGTVVGEAMVGTVSLRNKMIVSIHVFKHLINTDANSN